MEKVTGIGGVFVRSQSPRALADWYRSRLGIPDGLSEAETEVWRQEAGPTLLALFEAGTTYFAPPQQVMLNFRVRDLDAMVAQLRTLGEEVTVLAEPQPNGRFARLHDPEGNAVELWEPQGMDET